MNISNIMLNPYSNVQTTNFKASHRLYTVDKGKQFCCTSFLFRDDIPWKNFAELASKNFKNKDKVNTIMYAASDGSEAYTTIMSFLEYAKHKGTNANKFFPIKAYDVDNESIKAAQSGLINVNTKEYFLAENLYKIKINDYFKNSDKKLIMPNNNISFYLKTLEAKDILKENCKFGYGDMFQGINKIKDNSNTILMCRNVLAYFNNEKINNFINSISNILKKDSLFLIGDYDLATCKNIKFLLKQHGFEEITHNVFKKI